MVVAQQSPHSGEGAADDGKAPSRGLFRRKGNNAAESGEAPAGGEKGKRGKGEKPLGDEEYVDWVTGLSAPEPVNQRPRDDVPRRSLRSSTRQKDE